MNGNYQTRNRYCFGMGTLGRDMVYTMVTMYLMVFLTEILRLPDSSILQITGIITAARIFDAINDPFMGTIVDNTRSRWGKFKPWITAGLVLTAVFTMLLFTDTGLRGKPYIIFFAVVYVCWGIGYTMNDIGYWSLMPVLSANQQERERTGATARICANIGLFTVVAGIVPLTGLLAERLGSPVKAYTVFATGCVCVMVVFQLVTLFGVREKRSVAADTQRTTLKEMISVIFKNDQLLCVGISMLLFMIGYTTTTSFGLYFFKYAFRNENMYALFALVVGVSQIAALVLFPFFSKKMTRKRLYAGATVLVVAGYVIFFFSPMHIAPLEIGGFCIFFGQAIIQLLMLVFLTDTVEYGEWKFGKRNESVTFSIQPFIYKASGAIGSSFCGLTLVISGINRANTPDDVTPGGLLLMKVVMLIIPLVFILIGFLLNRKKFKIDRAFFQQITEELAARNTK